MRRFDATDWSLRRRALLVLWQAVRQQLTGTKRGEAAPCGGKGRGQLGNALEKGASDGSKTVDIDWAEVEVGSKHGRGVSRGKLDNRHMGHVEGSGHDRLSNLWNEGLITQLHAETRLLRVPCSSTLPLSIFG